MTRAVRFTLALAAVAAVGYAAYDYTRGSDGPGLTIEPTDYRFELPPPPGLSHTIAFRAVNRSARPVRVVGLATC